MPALVRAQVTCYDGCGNGAFLRAFGQAAPEWSMAGVEVSDRYRPVVEKIKGVTGFFDEDPARSGQEFLSRLSPRDLLRARTVGDL